VLTTLVEALSVLLQQRFAEAVDAAQRRAQVVRDRGAEGFQLPVYRRQLRRPLPHTLLQFFGESANLLRRSLALGDLSARP
jgi:hypothetical protein